MRHESSHMTQNHSPTGNITQSSKTYAFSVPLHSTTNLEFDRPLGQETNITKESASIQHQSMKPKPPTSRQSDAGKWKESTVKTKVCMAVCETKSYS